MQRTELERHLLTEVDRLRAECVRLEDHINDADDESIRLRADNERLTKYIADVDVLMADEMKRLRADNALLQEQLREWRGHATADELARLRAEVKRLTGWLYRHARRNSLTDLKEWKEIVDYLEHARAEVARLTAKGSS